MEMIGHHLESKPIDTEDPRQKLQPIAHPLASMLIVLPRELVDSAQKSTPHATIDAMRNTKRCQEPFIDGWGVI
jgi:hypothetical protein